MDFRDLNKDELAELLDVLRKDSEVADALPSRGHSVLIEVVDAEFKRRSEALRLGELLEAARNFADADNGAHETSGHMDYRVKALGRLERAALTWGKR